MKDPRVVGAFNQAVTLTISVLFALFLFPIDEGYAKSFPTECLGESKGAKGRLVYLHGFEPLKGGRSEAEEQNRQLLKRLAREFSLVIALPRGPPCPNQKLCWPSRDEDEVLDTFQGLEESILKCWDKDSTYSLVGFSNGGYYAFKIYKLHQDKRLIRIIASGSSGLWDSGKEKPNPLSRFQLTIGDRDITLNDAKSFAGQFVKSVPDFRLRIFKGGHHLDYDALKGLLGEGSSRE
ncbi:MAG: alpha/beta hydrolase [Chitinophagaceae bacterium]|nr:alpha/beta hydrolase [Oligoflexus sp.]